MHASHRVRAALAMLVAGTALAACGGADAPPPGSGSRLGAERFAALDAVLAAQQAAGDADPGELGDAARPVTAACAALDARDRLLAAIRRLCAPLTSLRARLADVGRCQTSSLEACLTLIDRSRSAARRFSARGREADRAIARAALRRACARALETPAAAYEVVGGLERGLAALERAVRAGSRAAVARARASLERAAASGEKLPGATSSLQRFREACA